MGAKVYIIFSPVLVLVVYLGLSQKSPILDITLDNMPHDPKNGEYICAAAGCASYHVEKGSQNKLLLAGGQAFASPFGTFYAPNVSVSKTYGIGGWSKGPFGNGVRTGLSPEGTHYFSAFPYTSYAKMTDQDVVDLWSFWQTLPEVEQASLLHDISWPLSIRRNVGIWKLLF